jgi:hypothetical protein
MSIPLDRLYHYILSIINETYGDDVIIYRFWPHGSKNLDNLEPLSKHTWAQASMFPQVYCNDQEPLQYDFYQNQATNFPVNCNNQWRLLLKSINHNTPTSRNLNKQSGIFEKSILLHSEKRSADVEKYQQKYLPTYYWSHAVIALDWFRYAQHIKQRKQANKTFLIYNRAWAGTREYRLKFLDLLLELNLENYCHTGVNPVDPELGMHYKTYQFKNPAWQPTNVLENFFPINTAPGHYSADFEITDYESADIEVVLETLFDDQRLHLTEKSLRPIACGQPFVLVATHGSLEYLRSYGFKTFEHIWDESYDNVENPEQRLAEIANLMRTIADWTPEQRISKLAEAQAVVEHNRQWFFSKEFFSLVINELTDNLKHAFCQLESIEHYELWLKQCNKILSTSKLVEFIDNNQNEDFPTRAQVELTINHVVNKLELMYKTPQ